MEAGMISNQELRSNKIKYDLKVLSGALDDRRNNTAGLKEILKHLDFKGDVKKITLNRQLGRCALCGKLFTAKKHIDPHYADDTELDFIIDHNEEVREGSAHYHHVLPRQFGITKSGRSHHSDFMKTEVNCVALHTGCHETAHNYNYRGMYFLDANAFKRSHGERGDYTPRHDKWSNEHKQVVERHIPYLAEELEI